MAHPWLYVRHTPTDSFAIVELLNRSIDKLYAIRKRRSTLFEAVNLRKDRSGLRKISYSCGKLESNNIFLHLALASTPEKTDLHPSEGSNWFMASAVFCCSRFFFSELFSFCLLPFPFLLLPRKKIIRFRKGAAGAKTLPSPGNYWT